MAIPVTRFFGLFAVVFVFFCCVALRLPRGRKQSRRRGYARSDPTGKAADDANDGTVLAERACSTS